MRGKMMYPMVVLAGVLALGAVFAGRAIAQPNPESVKVSGMVSCTTCVLPNACKAQTRLSCTLLWVSQGASYVLVTDDHRVYRLSGADKDLRKFAGESVTVTGELNGAELAVATVGKVSNEKHIEK